MNWGKIALLAAAGTAFTWVSSPAVARAGTVSQAPVRLPTVSGPIAVTATSHPFLTAKDEMNAAGYVEEEYFLSGQANVYDWVGSTRKVKVVAGPGEYVTRILVRRPRDASRFSGNVEVTILNASLGIDLGGPVDVDRMVQQGDVWIGITTKAMTVEALKRFDPVRYGPLSWNNPAPVATRCAQPSLIPVYMIGGQAAFDAMAKSGALIFTPNSEDGLVWDMLGQLGLLLKSDQRDKILPGFSKPWVYMDGISQSSLYVRTWLAAFHDRYRTADGKPVYDGYLGIVGPAMVRLNQCSADVTLDDPRQKVPTLDVPYISLSSEGEMWQGKYTQQPDAATPSGGIITYEVAGGSHGAGEVPGVKPAVMMAPMPDMMKTGFKLPSPGAIIPAGTIPAGATPNDFIWAPVTRGAYHNLQLWVRKGIVPPEAAPIELDANLAIMRDANGNAIGGVRTPYIDVPLASHVGSLGNGGFAGVVGTRKPLPAETLHSLYPDQSTYVAKFSAATDKSLADRWISAEDAEAMKKAASKAKPSF